ncbi:MAG TPA: molybdopterin-dependent oxidoreductase [Vicinamibacterales bacterium]
MPQRPGVGTLLWVSLSLAAAAVSALYLAARAFDVAFAPFALIDWLARVAPGRSITLFIDAMVAALRSLSITNLSSAAKTSEAAAGVVVTLVALTIVGSAILQVSSQSRRTMTVAGTIVGVVAGSCAAVPIYAVGSTRGAWDATVTVLVFAGWGFIAGWSRDRIWATADAGRGPTSASERRRFVRALTGTCAAIVLGGLGAVLSTLRRPSATASTGRLWSDTHMLPNQGARVTPVAGTRPEFTPLDDHYRIDINTLPPHIDGASWRLDIRGLVKQPMKISLHELRQREARHQFITLSCISNPVAGSLIGTQRWSGVPLMRVLDEVAPLPSASHLLIRSADGFDEVVAIDLIRSDDRIMLAYDWDGVALEAAHGFPLRLYIPDHYGMKQPKWIQSIEATDHWQPGYWVRRGWDREARMKTTSVIDVVGTDMMNVSRGPGAIVPIGGIAHAGARGIRSVEIRVDEGDWLSAELRQPVSDTTWVIWRYDWPYRAGRHTFTVRATDGIGNVQTATLAPPHPDGASGLHSQTVML